MQCGTHGHLCQEWSRDSRKEGPTGAGMEAEASGARVLSCCGDVCSALAKLGRRCIGRLVGKVVRGAVFGQRRSACEPKGAVRLGEANNSKDLKALCNGMGVVVRTLCKCETGGMQAGMLPSATWRTQPRRLGRPADLPGARVAWYCHEVG